MGDPDVLERASDSAMSDAEPVIGVTSGRSLLPATRPPPRSSWTRTAAVRSISAGSRPTWRQASSTVASNGGEAIRIVVESGVPTVPQIDVRGGDPKHARAI